MIVKLLDNVGQSYEPGISIQGVIYGGHIPKYDRKINVNNIKIKQKKRKRRRLTAYLGCIYGIYYYA